MKPIALGPFLLLFLAGISSAVHPAGAQTEPLYNFILKVQDDNGRVVLPSGGGGSSSTVVEGSITDLSNDPPNGLVPNGGVQVIPHSVSYHINATSVRGWSYNPPPADVVHAGQTLPFRLQINVDGTVESPFFRIQLTVDITTEDGNHHFLYHTIQAFYSGLSVFLAADSDYLNVAPRQFASTTVFITNRYLEPHSFTIKEGENPCGFGVVPPNQVTVGGLASRQPFTVALVTPAAKLWYVFGDTCILKLEVADADNPSNVQTLQLTAVITGTAIGFPVYQNAVLLLAAFLLLFFFLRRRKERLEEEILGKPQKPWLIPVEKVYLRHLKAKDQRAWYVVRHYLMEDEYRSSLMWYKAYKSATRGDRKKERLVLGEEKAYARWKAAWAKDIAKPIRKADRFEATLQRKLDRKARKAHRKATGKWRKEVRKLETSHAKAVEKEETLHAKLLARARKKGLAEPVLDLPRAPDLPDEPTLQARPLADHRWAKKEARFRRRMLKTQGDLEVKFEKADARRRLQLKRKVQKLANKLGDADFVAQHVAQD